MKKLNLYITEKLRINKNTNFKPGFSKDDLIFTLRIRIFDALEEVQISFEQPFEFISLEDNKLTYKTHLGKIVSQNVYLNNSNFFEVTFSNYLTAIFLSKEDGLDFLNELEKNDLSKELVKKYFNNIKLDKYKVVKSYSNNDLTTALKEYSK